jgi:hypothetical protein
MKSMNTTTKATTRAALAAAGLSLLVLAAGAADAQAPASAPAGSTGLCKDGTYSTQATKKGACRGHQGVSEWYAPAPAAAPAAAPAPAPAAAAPAPAPAAAAAAAPATSQKPAAFTPPATAAAGGGPGLVWVNSKSKVYHCQGDKWYGKTKEGQYESEADAKAQGNRPDHGKACS